MDGTGDLLKLVTSVILFPMHFQGAFIAFAMGMSDPGWLQFSKRLLLILPVGAIIVGCWSSVGCLLTIPVRQNRRDFITVLFITWWDLGKAILLFWGGLAKLIFAVVMALLGFARMVIFAVWAMIQDILMIPFAAIRRLAQVVVTSSIPWIAVTLTFVWCIIETSIFTFVMTPLVMDTFSNITGNRMTENMVQIPLFLFLMFIVLGSYAVLSTLVDAVRSRNVHQILGITVVEIIVLGVEVVFLYREFVDSLVPWLAQYSENFELGVFWTLTISAFVWFGIRSLTWFLFAAHGTPTILAVIQGKGLKMKASDGASHGQFFEVSGRFIERLKSESEWTRQAGERLIGALMLPPLQVIAAAINFCTLFILANHLFAVPFKDMEAVRYSEQMLSNFTRKRDVMRKSTRDIRDTSRPDEDVQSR